MENPTKEQISREVQIVSFTPEYALPFRDLNIQWIKTYFKLEEKDLQTLDNPQSYIIDKGGEILIAKYKGEVVGVAALLKMENATYELAKMAVNPDLQGKGIGHLLMQASIQKAKALGAQKLFLESNSKLEPALNLYRKFGFVQVFGIPSPYERADIQMELELA